MKKIILIIILMLTLGLTGCNKYKEYTELSYDVLQSKIDNKDSFVLVIGSNTCSACAIYKETMKEVIKDNQIEIFYIDNDKLNEEQYLKIKSKYIIDGTPTTVFIKEGQQKMTYGRIDGAGSYADVVKMLKQYGFIGD